MKILGTGSSLPKNSVTNFDLEAIMDTSDEWIRTRTGIEARHIVREESTTTLSIDAAQKALKNAGVNAEDLDLIVAATLSADRIIPMLSCEVQAALGAKKATAFDINAACSGFLFALSIAEMYIKTGRCHKALVIGAENLSKIMDWNDRSTCVLFGDGAGAAVVSDEADNMLGLIQGSDGASGMALNCLNRPKANPFLDEQPELKQEYVHMDGQAVYRFAVKTVPTAISQALEEAGVSADDISLFVLHQANLRIIESVSKRLNQPMEKFPINLNRCGNTSAASIPILLDEIVQAGKVKRGDKIVLSGFGAGLTWGACVIEW